MTTLAQTQAKANAVADTFNRTLRNVHGLPWTVEKVAGLYAVRALFDDLREPATGIALERADDVEAAVQGMEQGCRERGLYEKFAELPRAERRRLKRQMGEI